MRRRNLVEPGLARERCDARLVRGIAIAVQEYDRDRSVAFGARGGEVLPGPGLIEERHGVALRAHALVDFDHLLVEQLRQADVAVEDARPVLVGDAQLVAEAARDEERDGLALALEERVGGDRRPHLHGLDLLHRIAAFAGTFSR